MPRQRSRKPPAVIAQRLGRLRAAMKKHSITAYLITNRNDQIYLTGFDGEDGAALVTSKQVHLISDGRFDERIDTQAPWARKFLRQGDRTQELAAYLARQRLRRVAYQADHLSIEMHAQLRRGCRPVRLVPAPPMVNALRLSKDPTELGTIRQAIRIAEEAFKATCRRIKVGISESEIAALLEYEMKRRGAQGPSFPTIVAEGANAALPHATPGRRRLKANSLILIDWGAYFDHYCSDLTRVLFMGKIPSRLKRVYTIVLEAQEKAIAAIAPGKTTGEIDQVARDHITRAGFGKQFSHGLGHGVGLDIHEAPGLRPGRKERLQPGMVVTVEPGIYLRGVGGVRIEDDVLVTSSGHEVLTHLDKKLGNST